MKMSLANIRTGRIRAPLREIVYGMPGAGKSTFAAGAPSPIFLGSEDGTKRLDVARLPQAETFGDVLDGIALLAREEHPYKTLVIDTVDWLEPLVLAAVCQKYEADTIEDVKGGFGKGYTLALDAWRELLGDLERLQKIKGMHVLLLGHAEVKTFKNPSGEDFDRYRLKLNDKAANLLKEWVESILFAHVSINVVKKKQVGTAARYLYTTDAPGYDAKNRYGLPPRLPLHFGEFWKHWETGLPSDEGLMVEVLEGLAALAKADLKATHATGKDMLARAAGDGGKLRLLANWIKAKLEAHEESLASKMGIEPSDHPLAPDPEPNTKAAVAEPQPPRPPVPLSAAAPPSAESGTVPASTAAAPGATQARPLESPKQEPGAAAGPSSFSAPASESRGVPGASVDPVERVTAEVSQGKPDGSHGPAALPGAPATPPVPSAGGTAIATLGDAPKAEHPAVKPGDRPGKAEAPTTAEAAPTATGLASSAPSGAGTPDAVIRCESCGTSTKAVKIVGEVFCKACALFAKGAKTPPLITTCKGCGASIRFINKHPVDSEAKAVYASPHGQLKLVDDEGHVFSASEAPDAADPKLAVRGWVSHFSTCVKANEFRKPKKEPAPAAALQPVNAATGEALTDKDVPFSTYVDHLLRPGGVMTPTYADSLAAIASATDELHKDDVKAIVTLAKETHGPERVKAAFERVSGLKIARTVPATHPIVFRRFVLELPSRAGASGVTEAVQQLAGSDEVEF